MMIISPTRKSTVTNILIIINVVVYIILAIISGNIFVLDVSKIAWIAQYNPFVIHYGFWWTLFTSMFVHFDIVHILSNMFFLYLIGNRLELIVTTKKYLTIYFGGGLVGNILTLLIPNVISAGASGAIFSIFAYLIVVEYYTANRGYKTAIYLAIIMFIINMGVSTNLFAHFGGMITGLIMGYLDTKKYSKKVDYYTIHGVIEYY